jgi:hypothetical protein
MKKIVILVILLAFSIAGFSCGGGAGSSSSPHGENPGIPTIVRLLPSHYIALTNSAITLHAKVLDGNGAPVKNISVLFTKLSPIGTLSATTAKTNNSGLATVFLKSTQTGFVTIQAEVIKGIANVRDKKTVFYSSTLSLYPFMYLDVDGNNNKVYNENTDVNLFESGNADDNQVTIRATVYNKYGQRASGSTVTFGADSTEATFPNGNTATTDSEGQASVTVKVTPMSVRNVQTVLNITASAGNGAAGLVSLFLQPVTITGIAVTANPTVVAPDGTSTVSASVTMLNALPVPDGSTVSFVASCGTVDPFAQTINGLATAKFTAPSTVPSSPCRVTASIAGLPSSITTNFADITVTTDLSVIPATQTLNGLTGGAVTYIITGGVAPYTVVSGNKAAACNSTDSDCTDAEDSGTWVVDTPDASGNYIFTVTVPAGTATQNVALTVRDKTATSVNATLAISGNALSVQPGTVTKDGTTAGDVTFAIFGGVPPYNIFPNNANPIFTPNPALVANSGGTFKVSVLAGTPAAAIIYTVRDSAAATTTGTLNITAGSSQALTIIPGSASVVGAAPADTVTFTVSGGTAPYVITSTDPSSAYDSALGDGIWNVATSGGTFTVTVPANATTEDVTLDVFDSIGGTTSATLSIISGGGGGADTIVILPGSVTVIGAAPADTVTFTVSGGTPPYVITSTDPSSGCNSITSANDDCIDATDSGIWNVAASGGTFPVTVPANAASGDITLNVFDSLGNTGNAKLSVIQGASSTGMTLNPASISVAGLAGSADSVTFIVAGGTPPYSPFSANTAIAPIVSSTATTFTVNPKAVFASTGVTLTAVDSLGFTKTATITVTPVSSSLGVNPSTIAVKAGTSINFNIIGGVQGYTVYSSDTSFVFPGGNPLVIPAGTTSFTATTANPGPGSVTGTLTIVDSDGKTVTASVTVNP